MPTRCARLQLPTPAPRPTPAHRASGCSRQSATARRLRRSFRRLMGAKMPGGGGEEASGEEGSLRLVGFEDAAESDAAMALLEHLRESTER